MSITARERTKARASAPRWALVALGAYLLWNIGWLSVGCIPPSILKYATGYPCPTTGCARAIRCMAQGRLVDSVLWNPMCVPYIALLLLSALILAFAIAKKTPLRLPNLVGVLWLAALAVGWICKLLMGRAYW